MTGKLFLKRGKEKPLLHHHPWIFSGAVQRTEDVSDGETVDVYSAGGEWLARGSFNSRSQIVVRVWTFEKDEQIDAEFFKRRIVGTIHSPKPGLTSPLRISASQDPKAAYRLVNAESDFLPGVIIDRYANILVT